MVVTQTMVSAQCPYCSRQFGHRGKLNRHILCHTGEKPYPCSHCDARFRSNYALQRHVNSHSGAKPYYCQECDKAFSSKEHLARHFKGRTHQPIRCETCQATFKRIQTLRTHQCSDTVRQEAETTPTPSICLTCNRGFTSYLKLTQHFLSQIHFKQLRKHRSEGSEGSLETTEGEIAN